MYHKPKLEVAFHSDMKLLLIVAIIIRASAAVAKSTAGMVEQGRHVPRSESLASRNLRSNEDVRDAEQRTWDLSGKWIQLQLEQLYHSPEDMAKYLGLDKLGVKLFGHQAFQEWIKFAVKHSEKSEEEWAVKLLEGHYDIMNTVQIIISGKRKSDVSIHLFARKVEKHLLQHLASNDVSLKDIFKALKLNQITREEELYKSPLFNTWTNFAMEIAQTQVSSPSFREHHAFDLMAKVLQGMENFRDFELLYKSMQDEGSKKKLYAKWEKLWKKQLSWPSIDMAG